MDHVCGFSLYFVRWYHYLFIQNQAEIARFFSHIVQRIHAKTPVGSTTHIDFFLILVIIYHP